MNRKNSPRAKCFPHSLCLSVVVSRGEISQKGFFCTMEKKEEEEKQEEVVQFTYHESLNAAPLRKCGRKGVLGGLIELPRLR